MCGIAGLLSSGSKISEKGIYQMTNRLSHRGPDAKGVYLSDNESIALGHTRLSIIDLSVAANQPFFSRNKRYVVVFNGEIYNFLEIRNELVTKHAVIFKTLSDTEVIVEAFGIWGTGMVEKLQGMFAIAIVDQHEQKLFLFRDRLGKKPLFYFHSEGIFAFASEVKSLLAHPSVSAHLRPNRNSIGTFLHLGYIPEPYTMFEAIKKFPTGHIGEIGKDLRLHVKAYWRLERLIKNPLPLNFRNVKQKFSLLLSDAVQKRLISDVPLGAFLSGGTDSSLITALAASHLSKPLKTFGIGFKESKFDESIFAEQVAQHLKTDHTQYILEEKEAVDLVDSYFHLFDEPFADSSAIPTMLVSKLARKDVKVVLTGDGGDELFQGYGAYAWADRLENIFWRTFKQPIGTGMMLSGKNRLQRIGHLLEDVEPKAMRSHIFSQEQYFFTQEEIKTQLFRDPANFVPFEYDESFLANTNLSAGEKQAIFDIKYYLKDDLLVKVDRASMFYALECRSPFLDQYVVEFALSLDKTFKTKEGRSKWLLKDLLRDYLPNHLVDRPKWGFSIPMVSWLKGDLRYLIENFLSDEVLSEVGLCDPTFIRKLKKDFFDGKDYLFNRLWVLILLHKWMKENHV